MARALGQHRAQEAALGLAVLGQSLDKRINSTSAATSWASGESSLRKPRKMNSAKQHNGVGLFPLERA